jgi:hypothetical protein
MEYDVLEGCLDMDWSSWMIGDRAWERMLSAGMGSTQVWESAGKCAPLAHYAGKCHATL